MDRQKSSSCKKCYKFLVSNLEILHENLKKGPPDEPKGRSGHRITTCDTFLYSFGGYTNDLENHVLFPELWLFHLIKKVWVRMPILESSFPMQLASMSKIEKLGSKFLIHGGTGLPFGQFNSNTAIIANIQDLSITPLEVDGEAPSPRYGHACYLDQDTKRWYMVGGTSGQEFFMDIFYMDLLKLSWNRVWPSSTVSNAVYSPQPRYRHEIVLFNNQIIVLGGGTTNESFKLDELPTFCLKTRKWSKIQTYSDSVGGYPQARCCHSGILVTSADNTDPKFIITGGLSHDSRGTPTSLKDIWTLNLSTWQWYKWKCKLPKKLYFHDASLTPHGKMIIFGGIETDDRRSRPSRVGNYADISHKRTNRVFSCWVKIPRLSEMSWEALLFSHGALSTLQLKQLGVPQQFIARTQLPKRSFPLNID